MSQRIFGLVWDEDVNLFSINGVQFGEFAYVSSESANGGSYYVLHNDEDGLWDVMEMGGRGDGIWDREVATRLTSPLAAMAVARRDFNAQIQYQLEWERSAGLR